MPGISRRQPEDGAILSGVRTTCPTWIPFRAQYFSRFLEFIRSSPLGTTPANLFPVVNEINTCNKTSRFLTAVVIMLCVVIILQLGVILHSQVAPTAPTRDGGIPDRVLPQPPPRITLPDIDWNPAAQMAQMHDLIDSMTAFEEGWSDLSVTPSLGLRDAESAYEITLQLPGTDKSGIRVTMDGTILNIIVEYNAHHTSAAPAGSTNWLTHQAGRFERRLRLPSATSKHDAIKATFKDGLLRVIVPKATGNETTVRRIDVNESTQDKTQVTTPEAP